MLKPRQIERIVKGFANHRRVQIVTLLEETPEFSVQEIATKLKINYKTASEHVRRIANAGLINKRNRSSEVLHILSPLGQSILKFLRKLE